MNTPFNQHRRPTTMKSRLIWIFKTIDALLIAGLWLYGSGLLIWYPLRWWPGDRLWAVQLLNYLMPWLLLILIPGLMLAAITRCRYLAAVLAMPTLLIGLNIAPLFLPRFPTASADTRSFKVMSYNVWGYHNRDIEAIATAIEREQPDILLLQEMRKVPASALVERLKTLYADQPLYFAYDSRLGQGIISRYPLTSLEGVRDGRRQRVLVHTPSGSLNVWNVHLNHPLPRSARYNRQITALVEAIEKVEGPLILGGDFNTNDQSAAYRRLDQSLDNAHWEAGWGFGFSFPANQREIGNLLPVPIPIIRIDHIFYSHHFYARQAGTLSDSGGSDHRPVAAELLLK